MRKDKWFKVSISAMIVLVTVLFACNKDEEEYPISYEPINFLSPDSSTVFVDAGETFNFELYLAIDQAIDTIRAAYLVDTSMIVTNLNFADMDSIFFVQGFADSNNVQTISGSFVVPTGINDTLGFRPYFAGTTSNPYTAPSYDAIRIIFRLEGEDNTSYEKQLKLIIN